MNYIDKFGLWNVKPCIDSEPSGNDGLIVTAYAEKVGFEIREPLRYWLQLERSSNTFNYPIERLPGKPTPYPSRDFMLGAVYFRFIRAGRMIRNNWNFSPVPLPRLNIFKLAYQLWRLRGKHRNTFWMEKGYEQVYLTAFMVPFQDRAYYFRAFGENTPWYYRVIEAIDKKLEAKDNSSKLLRWVKYNQKPGLKVFKEYFGKDHPITKAAQYNHP